MIAVTGGSGFIGSTLCSQLREAGKAFRILDIRKSPLFEDSRINCDVCAPDDVREALKGCRQIIHLAAVHRDDVRPSSEYYRVNVGGAESLISAAEANGISSIVFTSSVAVYGLSPGRKGEDSAVAPFNDYGRSKLEAENLLINWARAASGRSLAIVRPTVVFGPGNRGNVYNLMRQVASGRFAMIGSGMNRKSMAYVENVANLLHELLNAPAGVRLLNYADKPDLSMNELVALIQQALGKQPRWSVRIPFPIAICAGGLLDAAAFALRTNFPISVVRVQKFCAETIVDSDVTALGVVPKIELREAMAKTVAYEFSEGARPWPVFYTE